MLFKESKTNNINKHMKLKTRITTYSMKRMRELQEGIKKKDIQSKIRVFRTNQYLRIKMYFLRIFNSIGIYYINLLGKQK